MEPIPFTDEMKKEYTILVPNMLPIHFKLLMTMLEEYGYKTKLLTNEGQEVIDTGLKYVHNDTCYPALLVIGQMINALQSGKYDLNKTALLITQTGGGCRASNYIHLLRKALAKAGMAHIPVISLNLAGLENDSSLKLSFPMLRKMISTMAYGDLMMLLKNQTMPYEINEGDCNKVINSWVKELSGQFRKGKGLSTSDLKRNMEAIAKSFADIKVLRTDKIKVGVVGEIYVKYSSLGNNGLERFLYEQDCEAMVPGLMGFILFKTDNRIEDAKIHGGKHLSKAVCELLMGYLKNIESCIINTVKKYPQYHAPMPFAEMKKLVDGIIGYGTRMGEGWLLTAEIIELIHAGYGNVVCAQPFGCLPNHIVGKGMIRRIKRLYPKSNIVPIDYDPGATKVNQENRIKLMLAVARENKEEAEIPATTAKKEPALSH